MGSTENFYPGANYGLDPSFAIIDDPKYGEFGGYRVKSSNIGYPTDPTTANQLKKTSDKISTGATTIEVSGVNIMGGGSSKLLDAIPKQHFKEINRLKQLTGVDLTFHGPLVEPTGIGRGRWSEIDREHAETEIVSALKRAHDLDPDGNIVVTFHSSNGLPEPETKVMEKVENEMVPVTRSISVIDTRTGEFGQLPSTGKDYFLKDGKREEELDRLKKFNESRWTDQLNGLNISVARGRERIFEALNENKTRRLAESLPQKNLIDLYEKSKTPEGQKAIESLNPELKSIAQGMITNVEYGSIQVQDSYQNLRELFNRAYENAKAEDKQKLDAYKNEMAKKLESWKNNPGKIAELADGVQQGLKVLSSLKNTPESYKPIKDFAVEKASETFSNAAIKAYAEFKDKAPIISIENPPAGSGISRAEDLRELVEASRKRFEKEAIDKFDMSPSEAKKTAEKLIGVTWDVGHINMLRKYGYKDEHLIKQTKTIAPFVKHVHLSDNFGIEHTELPMGMGNVPLKPMLEAIEKYNNQVKKIVETGDWFSRQGGLGLTNTPVLESMRSLGSPVYSGSGSPYWNQTASTYGSYFGGLGPINPDVHHQIYGAGFSTLPVELGGQMAGQNRLSGNPND